MQGYSSVPNPGYYPPQQPGGYPQAPGGYAQAPGGYVSPYPGQGYTNQPVPPVAPVAPMPVNFAGITYVYVPDPLAELAISTGVLIRQQPQFLEQITGCESPNRYYVFSQSPQAGMKLLFMCKELSECCQRNCCSASAREFIMDIKHVANAGAMNDNFQNSYVHVNKPFKCTCFCLERPEMTVSFSQGNQLIGKVKQPFTCCDPEFTVYDNAGVARFYIHADCCQCGILCSNNFCGKMSEALFNIYTDIGMTQPVGSIIKKVASFSEMVTSADSYQVNFPATATPNEKLLLIVPGLMIDYQFFEQKADNDNTSRTY